LQEKLTFAMKQFYIFESISTTKILDYVEGAELELDSEIVSRVKSNSMKEK